MSPADQASAQSRAPQQQPHAKAQQDADHAQNKVEAALSPVAVGCTECIEKCQAQPCSQMCTQQFHKPTCSVEWVEQHVAGSQLTDQTYSTAWACQAGGQGGEGAPARLHHVLGGAAPGNTGPLRSPCPVRFHLCPPHSLCRQTNFQGLLCACMQVAVANAPSGVLRSTGRCWHDVVPMIDSVIWVEF